MNRASRTFGSLKRMIARSRWMPVSKRTAHEIAHWRYREGWLDGAYAAGGNLNDPKLADKRTNAVSKDLWITPAASRRR